MLFKDYQEAFDYLDDLDMIIARLLYEGYNQTEIADCLLISRKAVGKVKERIVEATKRQIATTNFHQQWLDKWAE